MANRYRTQTSASRQPQTKEYTYSLGESARSGPFIRTGQGTGGRNCEFINSVDELDSYLARAEEMKREYEVLKRHLLGSDTEPETAPAVDSALNAAIADAIKRGAIRMEDLIGTANVPPVRTAAPLPDEPEEEDELVFLKSDVVQYDTRKFPYTIVSYDVKKDIAKIKRLPWDGQPAGQRATTVERATERLSLWDE
tara:strand:- start:1549 stop:2136 length:588 start_codon:yes stop_codon:yes gene_type:complete